MRSFVVFLLSSYLQALGMLARVVTVYVTALAYGTVEKPEIWQIVLMIACVLITVPLFIPISGYNTPPCQRWGAFFMSIGLMLTAIITFCYPISQWPQGIFFGVIGLFALLWLVVGRQMIMKYLFLIQRGWTEKEKVARKRARRRRYSTPSDINDEEDESDKNLPCK